MKKDKMGKCMSEWTDKHPKGRSNEPMNKKNAHKQAVAACLNKTRTIKEMINGMTFSHFLIAESRPGMDIDTVRGFIRRIPMYHELIKDPQIKPRVFELVRDLVGEFGDGPIDPGVKDHIQNQFDDLYASHSRGGANIGDWEGEAERKAQASAEEKMDRMSQEFERGTGTDAVTGEKIKKKLGARTGTDAMYDTAKRDMASFSNRSPSAQSNDLAQAQAASQGVAVQRAGSKANKARAIFDEMYGDAAPRDIKARFMSEVGLTKAGANTYFYNLSKKRKEQDAEGMM